VKIITKIQQNYNTFLENKNSKNKNIRDLCIIIAIFYYNELRLLIKNRSQHSFRTIQRAMIIFDLTNRIDIVSISNRYNVSRNSVYNTIKRVVEIYEKYGNHPNFSFKEALEDHKRPGRAPIYDEKEITRILLTCCADPMALGHYSECWTVTTLTNHINKARSEENINNRKISRSKIYKAIYSCGIRIDSIEYYLEKRDSDFDKKAINILNSLEFAKVIAGEVSFEDFQKRNDLKDIDIDSISAKMVDRLEEGSKSYAGIVAKNRERAKADTEAKGMHVKSLERAATAGLGTTAALGAGKVIADKYAAHKAGKAAENAGVARETAAKARATVADNKPSTSSAMDKVRGTVSHAKDTAKEAYSQFSHSPKAQMVAGGTAAALGAGLAAKRYMQRKKKK